MIQLLAATIPAVVYFAFTCPANSLAMGWDIERLSDTTFLGELSFVSWVPIMNGGGDFYVDSVNNKMYIASNTIIVEDISDKTNPTEISHIIPLEPGSPGEIEVYENYAYVSWGTGKIRTLDISENLPSYATDPIRLRPRVVYSLRQFHLEYPNLYLVEEDKDSIYFHFLSVDLSDMENPEITGDINLNDIFNPITDSVGKQDYVKDENYVYMTFKPLQGNNNHAQIAIIDVSNQVQPLVSTLDLGEFVTESGDEGPYGPIPNIAKRGDYLYITGIYANPTASLKIVNVADPQIPVLAQSWYKGTAPARDEYYSDIDISGDHAYVSTLFYDQIAPPLGPWNGDIRVLDLSNPIDPVQLGAVGGIGQAKPFDIKAIGTDIYLKQWDDEYDYIVDASSPEKPYLKGTVVLGHGLTNMDVDGNYIYYVLWDQYQFNVVDISDKNDPFILTRNKDAVGKGFGIFVKDDIAYVPMNQPYPSSAPQNGGFYTFDISDPADPHIIGWLPPNNPNVGDAKAFVDDRMVAYTISGYPVEETNYPGFRTIDVSDPAAPAELGTYPLDASKGLDVYASGNYAYLSYGDEGLYIMDVANPATLTLIKQWKETNSYVRSAIVQGDFAYVCDGNQLKILDVTDKANPVNVGHFDFSGCNDVTIIDNYAYIVGADGVKIVDVSDETAPIEVAAIQGIFMYDPYYVDVQGEYIYAMPFHGGIYILRWGEIDTTSNQNNSPVLSLNAFPNPFREIINIQYQLPDNSTPDMVIYDVAGRLIKQFNQLTNNQSLINQISWDGRDDGGKRVSSGIYFLKLTDVDQTKVEKLLVIK